MKSLVFLLILCLEQEVLFSQTLLPQPPSTQSPLIDNIKNASNTLQQTLSSTIATLQNIELLYRQTADSLLSTNEMKIRQKVADYRSQLAQYKTTNVSVALSVCLERGNFLDVLSDRVVEELNNCAIVTLAEVVNIISDSINEAQAFMSLPTMMAGNIENCGLAPECLPKIVTDAFYESLETPSKVLVLAARVQQFAFHSVGTVTGCALDAVGNVVDLGAALVDGVVACVQQALSVPSV